MTKKIKTTILIPQPLAQNIEMLAQKTGKTKEELVRDALTVYVGAFKAQGALPDDPEA